MKVRLQMAGHYIAIAIETARGSKILRRWPWPHDPFGRSKHLRDATRYGEEFAALLTCSFEIDKGLCPSPSR